MRERAGQPLCARQPGRGVAQQAVAGRAVRGSGTCPRRAARPENHRVVGTRRGSAGAGGRARRRGAALLVAQDIDRRSRRARSRRRADDLRRHRSDARRRRARHADRRHLRSDASVAQRAVGAGDITISRDASASVTIFAAARASGCACSTSRRPKCWTRSSAGWRPYDGDDARLGLLWSRHWRRRRVALGFRVRGARALARAADASDARRPGRPSRSAANACACGPRGISTRRAKSPRRVRIAGSRIRSTSGRPSWAWAWRSSRISVAVTGIDRVVSRRDADRRRQERGGVPAPHLRRPVRSLSARSNAPRSGDAAERRFSRRAGHRQPRASGARRSRRRGIAARR